MKLYLVFLMILFVGKTDPCNAIEILADTVAVGDYAYGGIVFWVDEGGQHGLVCAKEDQIREIYWNDEGTEIENMNTKSNKTDLPKITNSGTRFEGKSKIDNLAAKVCADYSVTVDGIVYDDWYLPSKEELLRMYENKLVIDRCAIQNGGSFLTTNNELSPTEFCNSPSWDQVFNYGYQDYDYKNSKLNVRAIRAF